MKKIKIAQVITRMDWGGSPDIVRMISESLSSSHQVMLITGLTGSPTAKTRGFLDEFKDNLITVPHLKREINLLRDFLALIELYFIFKKEKFDIVHTHTAKAGFLGRIAAHLARVEIIVHMPHGHNFYGYFGVLMSRLIVTLERFCARFTDKILVLTELEKRDYSKFKIKPLKGIDVILPGLRFEEFSYMDDKEKDAKRKQLGLKPADPVVGLVSRLEPVKGAGYFLDAAHKIAGRISNVKFLVAGEGSLRHDLEKQAESSGIKEKIRFLGWREDALEIIAVLDVLVQPSLNEAVGRVLIEAGACGVPVVATDAGGIPEIVRN
ncbi:MAG TPA: glycosyltransferase family 1 protein, partial [Nitrospirae bacterium]|nr:glycosyltransferase family 1 protein [Nitrospirota bacterium]